MFHVSCGVSQVEMFIVKLPNYIVVFDVKYSLMPRTEGYMVYNRTNTAETDCRRARFIDEKGKKKKKKTERSADAAVLEQPERLRQSAEPSETTHCQDQGK